MRPPPRALPAIPLLCALLLFGCSGTYRDGSLYVRLEYPPPGDNVAARSASGSGDPDPAPALRPDRDAARPAYVQDPSNRIRIRVLAPHIPVPIEGWFDRSAGRGVISGIPPGDRIAVEVDEFDNTATTLLGRGFAQGIPLAAGESKTVPVPMYGKGTILRVCGASPAGGSGTAGDTGDGGLAGDALLGQPLAVAVGPDDSIYVSSAQYDRVRVIDRYGYISHYAGSGPAGPLSDGAPAATSPIGPVYDMDIGPAGELYLITWDQQILKVDAVTGLLFILYDAQKGIFNPSIRPDLAVVDDNTIYYTNRVDNRVYLVSGGARSDFVADNLPYQTQEGADRFNYPLKAPSGVANAVQSSGLLFADRDNNKIKRVSFMDNLIYTEISGTITRPDRIDFDPIYGRTFFSEEFSNTIKMIDYTSGIKVIAGNGTAGYSGDGGPGASAQLRDPSSVAVDSRGNVYIADTGNHAIRVVLGGALP
ncbi:MAG: hypothetical protein Kow00128_00010 [Deltaproteobacteria bacterium]